MDYIYVFSSWWLLSSWMFLDTLLAALWLLCFHRNVFLLILWWILLCLWHMRADLVVAHAMWLLLSGKPNTVMCTCLCIVHITVVQVFSMCRILPVKCQKKKHSNSVLGTVYCVYPETCTCIMWYSNTGPFLTTIGVVSLCYWWMYLLLSDCEITQNVWIDYIKENLCPQAFRQISMHGWNVCALAAWFTMCVLVCEPVFSAYVQVH